MTYKSDVGSKLKSLASNLWDTSDNLRSLDNFMHNSPPRTMMIDDFSRSSDNVRYGPNENESKKSLSNIQQSIDNILLNQTRFGVDIKKLSDVNCINEPRYKSSSLTNLRLRPSSEPLTTETFENVEKRLRDAHEKLRSSRKELEQKKITENNVADVSKELITALEKSAHNVSDEHRGSLQQIETSLIQKMAKLESEKKNLQFELDSRDRDLAQEKGKRNALMRHLECTEAKIIKLETELSDTKKGLDKQDEEVRALQRKCENYERIKEKITVLQKENDNLKMDQNNCDHYKELDELRKQREKLERKCATMTSKLEETERVRNSKESQTTQLLDDIRHLQEETNRLKLHLAQSEERNEQSEREIKIQVQRNLEANRKVENLEYSLIEAEANKNKGFALRDDNIERMENNVHRLKAEVEKLNDGIQKDRTVTEGIYLENESLRKELTDCKCQTDMLQRELESLLEARSIQDEQLKRSEKEKYEYIRLHKELKISIETAEREMERFKCDADLYHCELNEVREIKAVQEEKINGLHEQICEQRKRLATVEADKKELEKKVNGLERHLDDSMRELNELRDRELDTDNMRRHMEDYRNQQEKISRQKTEEHKFAERDKKAQMERMQEMLTAERAASKVLMDKSDRQMNEIKRLHDEFWMKDQLSAKLRRKLVKVQQELEELKRKQEIEKGIHENALSEKTCEHEVEIENLTGQQKQIIEERDQILRWLLNDIDSVVDLVSHNDFVSTEANFRKGSIGLLNNSNYDLTIVPPTSSALATLGGLDINKTFIHMKSKVSWIRTEANRILCCLQNYRSHNNELIEELKISEQKLDHLNEEKKMARDEELEEARKCLAKWRLKEKNEVNLQVKCHRLQEELKNVRQQLRAKMPHYTYQDNQYT